VSSLTPPREPTPFEIDSTDPDRARTLIILKPVDPEIVASARYLAQELAKDPRENMHLETFIRRATEAHPSASAEPTWQRVLALAGYFTINSSGEPYSFSRTLPRGLLDLSAEHHAERVSTLIRYAFVNRLGFDSARKIETISNLHFHLRSTGLKNYVQHNQVGALSFFEVGFPAETSGDDPAIRTWAIDAPRKWTGPEGAALSARATAWMLRFGEGMVRKNDDGIFTFDLERMRHVVWHEVFERHGMRCLIDNEAAGYRTYRDVLAAGAALFGRPDLFGYSENQLLPGVVRPRSRWIRQGGDDDKRLFGDALWRDVRSKHPEVFDDEGLPIPSQLKRITDWRSLLSTPLRSSISHTFGSVRGFLEQTTPEIFGWERWQLKPWEMDHREGKWDGPEGHARFISALSYLLARHGLGKLTLRDTRLDYDLTTAHLATWNSRCASGEIPTTLRDYLPANGLAGGLAYAAHSSVNHALEKLFGEENPGHLARTLHTKAHSKVLAVLLAKHGGAFRFTLDSLSPDDAATLLSDDPAVRPEPSDPDMLLLGTHSRPLLHQKFAILTKHDITLWRELRVDPGSDRKLQESFFGNRSWKGTPMESVELHSREQLILARLLEAHRERGSGVKMIPVTLETITEAQELRVLLDLARLKLIDSINIHATAGSQLKEALLRVTQSSLHPARILKDSGALQEQRNPHEPSMLDLLDASILFAVKVEAARAG
jgi:hypothetical protein